LTNLPTEIRIAFCWLVTPRLAFLSVYMRK